MGRMNDWWELIDKNAALKEQFPRRSTVERERPGTKADRARQAFYYADNRTHFRQIQSIEVLDADAFIRRMEEKPLRAYAAQARKKRRDAAA